MFHFLHKKYPKDETALIFSIESGEVVSALVQFKTDEKPLVFYTKRVGVSSDTHNDAAHLTTLMLFALKKSAEDIVINGFKHFTSVKKQLPITNMYVFLGSLWHKSETLTTRIEKDKPFIITTELLEEESEKLFKKLSISGLHIEKKIISVKANGYDIEEPLGKKVTSADLKAYVSAAPEHLIDEIETIIFAALPNFKIVFHTITLSVFTVVSRILPDKNFILLIPQSQVSEFILISNKTIEESVSVPFGRHRLIDQIVRELGVSKPEALSLLKLWKEKTLNKAKETMIETVVLNAKNEWFICLKGALSNLTRSALLPNQIYIVGHSLESVLLSDWIKDEEYTSQTFLVDKFQTAFFSQKNMADSFDSKVPKEEVGAVIASLILFTKSL